MDTQTTADLKQFLIERKLRLLDMEKRSGGYANDAITLQIQNLDVILIFLSTKQTEADMAKLQLSLDKQLHSLDELKPRQENAELTEAIIELAGQLKPGTFKPLDNLPKDMKAKTVSSKIYGLRTAGKIPKSIKPIQRGNDLFLAKLNEEDTKKEEEKERRKQKVLN